MISVALHVLWGLVFWYAATRPRERPIVSPPVAYRVAQPPERLHFIMMGTTSPAGPSKSAGHPRIVFKPPPPEHSALPTPPPIAPQVTAASPSPSVDTSTGPSNPVSSGSSSGQGGGGGNGIGGGSGAGSGTGDAKTKAVATALPLIGADAPTSVRPVHLVAVFEVSAAGVVRLLSATPTHDKKFDAQVRESLEQIKFRPATRHDGTPVPDTVALEWDF